jgi:hypothetical protein
MSVPVRINGIQIGTCTEIDRDHHDNLLGHGYAFLGFEPDETLAPRLARLHRPLRLSLFFERGAYEILGARRAEVMVGDNMMNLVKR